MGYSSNEQLGNSGSTKYVSDNDLAPSNSFMAHQINYVQNILNIRLELEFVNGTNLYEFVSQNKLLLRKKFNRVKSNPAYVRIGENMTSTIKLGDNIHPNIARHVLIVTSFRSGSTFLGDLLNRYPGTFYTFEPLRYSQPREQSRAVEFVSQVFKCNPEHEYFVQAKNERSFTYKDFRHNFRLWNVCQQLSINVTECFVPELYYKACPIFPIRLIKTVRMRVRETEKLLNDSNLEKTLKIVVLVRDPRGVINSRQAMPWCDQSCRDPLILCKNLQDDVLAAHELEKKYPGWFFTINIKIFGFLKFSGNT